MAPKYKLTYFNARGIAEVARLIFAHAEVEYEDNRIAKEDWPELKSKQPFGKIPVLEVDGQILAESAAINNFLAREFELAGKSNFETARAAMIIDALKDVFSIRSKFIMEQDEAKKEELKKSFLNDTLPPFLDNLSKLLEENGNTYLVGSSTTYADIGAAYALSELVALVPNVLDKYENLRNLVERVNAIPSIKQWIEKRPVTPF